MSIRGGVMPCVGFICPATRAKVPFNHFDECEHGPKGRPAYSPFLARVAALKEAGDIRHTTLELTGTGVMSCPRAIYLTRTTPYYLNPARAAAMHRGTALHGVAADPARGLDPTIWSTEGTDPVRHDLRGTIGGFPISALADAWRLDLTEIADHKFPKDWSVKYRAKDGSAKPEVTAQLNIERHLMAQQTWAQEAGYDPATVRLTVFDHGIGAEEGPMAQACDHLTEDQILAIRPWGAATTIADHASLLVQIREQHEAITPGDDAAKARLAASIPLIGQPMFKGSMCGSCAVKEQCDSLVRQFGVPS